MYNVFHGDFHLGNIIIMNDYTVGIIDFGIVYIVTDKISNDLFNIMFLAIVDNKKMKIDFLLRQIFYYSQNKFLVTSKIFWTN